MAGCPYAVGLSKLALHPVMKELWSNPALTHLDLFVDDSGYDVEHRNPEKCASNAYKIWKDPGAIQEDRHAGEYKQNGLGLQQQET